MFLHASTDLLWLNMGVGCCMTEWLQNFTFLAYGIRAWQKGISSLLFFWTCLCFFNPLPQQEFDCSLLFYLTTTPWERRTGPGIPSVLHGWVAIWLSLSFTYRSPNGQFARNKPGPVSPAFCLFLRQTGGKSINHFNPALAPDLPHPKSANGWHWQSLDIIPSEISSFECRPACQA